MKGLTERSEAKGEKSVSTDNIKPTDEERRVERETWANRPNYSVPNKEKLFQGTPEFVENKVAWYAIRAIMQQVEGLAMPSAYMVDLAADITLLYKDSPEQFVYCIRAGGTHICYLSRYFSVNYVVDTERIFDGCNWFTFDINDIRNKDNYNEPQLRPCTPEEAIAFYAKISTNMTTLELPTPEKSHQ